MPKILGSRVVEPGQDYLSSRHSWPVVPPPNGRELSCHVTTLRKVFAELIEVYAPVYWSAGKLRSDAGERMGVLAGRFLRAGPKWAVEVRGFAEVPPRSSGRTHASMRTRDIDDAITRARTASQADGLVGWYHTHPGMDLFLSDQDKKTYDTLFHQPWHVAMVFDPGTWRAAYFLRDEGGPTPGDRGVWREISMALEGRAWSPCQSGIVRVTVTSK